MNRSYQRLLILLAAYLAVPLDMALAAPSSQPFVPNGEAADAPAGFVAMCRRDALLCRAGLPGIGMAARAVAIPAADCRSDPQSVRHFFAAAFSSAGSHRSAGLWSDDDMLAQPCAAETSVSSSIASSYAAAPVVGMPLDHMTGLGTAATGASARTFTRYRATKNTLVAVGGNDAAMIRAINKQVNRQVVRVSDSVSKGMDEEWDRPGTHGRPPGDCEDFAIEKRMRLLDAGFPADRMFFAVVYKARFGLHTVLVARLKDGDYVLDSATPDVVRWSNTPYTWLRAQSPNDPMLWTRISASPSAAS